MARTDGIGDTPTKGFANRPAQPALGNDGGRGKGTSNKYGNLLLPLPSNRSFSPMEARFITEYLKDPVAPHKDIALRAGYSPHTAKQQATQIMKRSHVLAEIQDQMHAFVQRERLSIQRIVRHLIELSEVDKREFYNEDGSLKSLTELTKVQASLVNGVTVQEIWDIPGSPKKVQIGELKKITFTNHLDPIKMLAKSLQGFMDKVEVKTQSVNYHEHHNAGSNAIGDIDYTVLLEDELLVLKGLYDTIRERTRTKTANSRQQLKGVA